MLPLHRRRRLLDAVTQIPSEIQLPDETPRGEIRLGGADLVLNLLQELLFVF